MGRHRVVIRSNDPEDIRQRNELAKQRTREYLASIFGDVAGIDPDLIKSEHKEKLIDEAYDTIFGGEPITYESLGNTLAKRMRELRTEENLEFLTGMTKQEREKEMQMRRVRQELEENFGPEKLNSLPPEQFDALIDYWSEQSNIPQPKAPVLYEINRRFFNGGESGDEANGETDTIK